MWPARSFLRWLRPFLGFALAACSHAADDLEFFEKRVRPVLAERCYSCHSGASEKLKGGLRVDSREALLQGGDSGPAIDPGRPERSRLIDAIGYGNVDLQMPPKKKLGEGEIADLAEWVRRGAPWPGGAATAAGKEAGRKEDFDLEKRKASHWVWRGVQAPPVPVVKREGWVRQPIDAFLLSRLEQEGLGPAPEADRRILIRRVYFDLIGLPPSSAEVEAFVADRSAGAWETVVDRLLASPRFGERWGRHWLDLVRYAETLGHEFDYVTPNAWRYRDYVIRALNADVPYDQFVREHVAGDLVDPPRRHPVEGFNESMMGTAFYWLGQRTHSPVDVKLHQAEVLDDQIDVLSKAFLGVTVACARCHDHKFDAISARDYYSLYGILGSSRYTQRAVEGVDGGSLQGARAALTEALERDLGGKRPGAGVAAGDDLPAGYRVFADFEVQGYEGWFREGAAFGERPAAAGDWVVLADDRVARLGRGAAHSAAMSRRLQGALSSPTFVITNRYIHVLAAGRSSRINVPVEGFTMIRDPIYGGLKRRLDHDEFRWVTIDLEMWRGRRAYVEFSDLPTPDLADDGSREGFALDGYVAVAQVVFSEEGKPPTGGASPTGTATLMEVAAGTGASEALKAFRGLEAGLQNPRRVPGMLEGTGVDEFVFVRGNARNPGEVTPRRFLEALSSDARGFGVRGSGRWELAVRMTAPDNPLVPRVLVNRVWHHLFGRGIVATPDDFGVLGQLPTHPELLDWLAHWFRTEGEWSVKRLIRLMVTSRAYQMSSRPADALAEERDPSNRWWHRMPIRRLQGEAIRDAILALSGRLDETMYGPPVPVHLTEFMDGRGRPARSGPMDGAGRRSIYLEVRRNFPIPMMRAFDTPVPFTTVGRRTVSNVPAQSLILLNDPFVQGEATRWAERTVKEGESTLAGRLDRLYRGAFGRSPTASEVESAREFLERQGQLRGGGGEAQAWADLCHVLFNVKEFVYVN